MFAAIACAATASVSAAEIVFGDRREESAEHDDGGLSTLTALRGRSRGCRAAARARRRPRATSDAGERRRERRLVRRRRARRPRAGGRGSPRLRARRLGAAVGLGGDARTVLAELAGVAAGAAHRHPVHDQPAADAARAAVEVDDVVDAARRRRTGARRSRRGSRRCRRRSAGPVAALDEVADRARPIQCRCGASRTSPSARADEPGHREADRRRRARRASAPSRQRADALCRRAGAVSSGVSRWSTLDALAQRRCRGRGPPRRS